MISKLRLNCSTAFELTVPNPQLAAEYLVTKAISDILKAHTDDCDKNRILAACEHWTQYHDMNEITKDNLFKPKPSRSESKSATTDKVARAITDRESAERRRKTERLRAARLARENAQQQSPVLKMGSAKNAKPHSKKGI